jgi:hypothetical protein
VAETSTRTVKLWRSLGFNVLARIPEAFAHPDHGDVAVLIMHQKLLRAGGPAVRRGPRGKAAAAGDRCATGEEKRKENEMADVIEAMAAHLNDQSAVNCGPGKIPGVSCRCVP